MSENAWVAETITPGIRVEYEATRIIARRRTQYQEMVALENPVYGRMMFLDEAVQVTSADEFMYHEMLAHVPLLTHGAAKQGMIVGGGDCGLAEEVLKHRGVVELTQVEIDPDVVEFAREHFSAMNARAFADSRFRIEYADAAKYVAQTEQRFDAVLVDSTDPIGPGKALFTEEFYRNVRARLKPGGVLVAQCGMPFQQRTHFAAAMHALSAVFPIVTCYLIAVPSYTSGHMALAWASESLTPAIPLEELKRRAADVGLETRYYTPQVHLAAFALPPYVTELLPEAARSARINEGVFR